LKYLRFQQSILFQYNRQTGEVGKRLSIGFLENNVANGRVDGKWWPAEFRNYHGPIDSKLEVLKYYRFSFAYENTKNVPGYITEKIFDSFHAGTVPIYLGAPNVWEYIPDECFIARADFQSDEELYHYLKNMPKDVYAKYLDNIDDYLHSDQAKLFSKEHFIQIFMDAITQ